MAMCVLSLCRLGVKDVLMLPPYHQYFIRQNTSATMAHRMQYLGESVHQAARSVVETLRRDGGAGGVIALDNQGNGKYLGCWLRRWLICEQVATPLNCPGMYRGLVREDGVMKTAIFDDEVLE
jgi:L-asparaginase / beta-aspartyl-peptidase